MSEDTAERDETVWGEGGDTQAESEERRPEGQAGRSTAGGTLLRVACEEGTNLQTHGL